MNYQDKLVEVIFGPAMKFLQDHNIFGGLLIAPYFAFSLYRTLLATKKKHGQVRWSNLNERDQAWSIIEVLGLIACVVGQINTMIVAK